jgi:outer membrane protein
MTSEAIQAGPIVRYDLGRDSSVKDKMVSRLPDVKGSLELGAFIGTGAPLNLLNLDTDSIVTARVGFVQGLNGGHEGYLIEGALALVSPLFDNITLVSALSTAYMSENYAESYFGVSYAGSAASGLKQYGAGAGFRDAAFAMVANFEIDHRWSTSVVGNYARLVGDAVDSPIVEDQGSPNQLFFGLGLGYRIF